MLGKKKNLIKVVIFMVKVLELQESVSRLQASNDELQSRLALTENGVPDKNGDDLTGASQWKQVRGPKGKIDADENVCEDSESSIFSILFESCFLTIKMNQNHTTV